VGEIWLPVHGVLVLTHNFEMRKPEKARLPVFTICGLRLQICQWQNCKSKQAEVLKQKFAAKLLFLNNSYPNLQMRKKNFFNYCKI